MTLALRNDFFSPLQSSLLDDFFLGPRERRLHTPAVNIKETKNGFAFELSLPGVKKEDLDLELDSNVLTIKAQRKLNDEVEGEKYLKREFGQVNFERSFRIPETIDREQIKAKFEDGILHITVPKSEKEKSLKIELQD